METSGGFFLFVPMSPRRRLLCLLAALASSSAWLSAPCHFRSQRTALSMSQQPGFDGTLVTLGDDGFGGKGLLARKDFAVGEIICTVPLEMCILARRDGVIAGLVGQSDMSFDSFGDLREVAEPEVEMQGATWDLRLAVALLEATSGASLHRMGPFWDGYLGALPTPLTVCLPFCMPERVLNELQDAEMAESAKAQQKRLSRLGVDNYNDLSSHRITSNLVSDGGHHGHVPTPLEYAFAMVRSRCFQIAKDWFGVVPVIEIANHCSDPNAQFSVIGENFETASCLLTAVAPIEAGKAVTISYDASSITNHDNRRLFQQYGFLLEDNSSPRADLIIVSSDGGVQEGFEADAANSSAVEAAVELLVDAALHLLANGSSQLKARVQSTASSLGSVLRSNRCKTSVEDQSAASLLIPLAQKISLLVSDFQTTVEVDEALLAKLLQGDAITEDGLNRAQYMACLRYRLDKKYSLLCASHLVELAVQSLNKQADLLDSD